MKQKVNKHNKKNKKLRLQKWTLIVAVLALIAFLFFSLIPYRNLFDKLFLKLSKQIQLPLTNLILIILLSLIVFLTLYLYLRCLFKKNKKKSSNTSPSKPEEKLPPKEYMDKILQRIGENEYLNQYQICGCFADDNKTTIHHYLDLLLKNNYIQLKTPDYTFSPSYILSNKGREYLVENNLLSK
ncbi:MAG: hypothetical protein KAU01_11410 [Candidatus Cloacimonetes bacterium]|nr:hypothetical protein [Candidatus Cloacimonadota bacterium]